MARNRKICGAPSPVLGAVDFGKNCEELRGYHLPLTGRLIPYRRCQSCGFLFTDYFDGWSDAEFEEHIYNASYQQVDPDYASVRPSGNARMIADLFGSDKEAISVLDVGGGNGQLVANLRGLGFPSGATYEPFNPEHNVLPERKFNLITCFETLEHTPDPVGLVRMMSERLEDEGMVLFSTLVLPANFSALGLSWWYVGPRNGHISIHSAQSLRHLWSAHGFSLLSHNANLHCAFRKVPDFAKRVIPAA
jgi:2-polyprenyl-6-hydroxyphenyl methylase/3-demethylubiquinone-9 3-methyltransferase